MGKYISGINKQSNLDKWADYAKQNSYDGRECSKQSRHDLDASNIPEDSTGRDMSVPRQRREEGRCFAEINPAAKPNTYTTDKGTKRG